MKKTFIYSVFIIFVFLSLILNCITIKDSILLNNLEKDFKFIGIIEEIKWKQEEESKYVIKIKNIENKEINYSVNEKVMLKIIGERDIEIGDIITFNGKLKKPMENTNPKLFNYKQRLLSEKVYTTITIKDHSLIKVNKDNKKYKYKMRVKFREDINNIFDSNLNQANSDLMKSIILGENSYLEDEDIAKYRDLGLAHILAVSGLHIGIISGFLLILLSNLRIKRKKVYFIILFIIWYYGFLIGYPPSLIRANIMMTILFLAKISDEPNNLLNSLFLAMVLSLIINPFWILNVGFQLSYIATFSIIYLTPKIQAGFYPYENKIIYALSGILGVQIGLLPIQAYYFNEIPVLTILTNLLIAPILSMGLVIASLMIFLNYFISIFNPILALVLDIILTIQFNLVEIIHKIPYGKIVTHSPSLNEMLIYYFILLIVFQTINIKKIKTNIKKTIICFLVFYIIFTSINISRDKSLELHFIDVGQGDSIFIKSRKGNYLIDTGGNLLGSFDVGENITLPYLKKHGIKRINGIFISHFHEDHCKSLPLLIDNLKVDKVFMSYENPTSEAYNYIIENNIPYTILKEKDRLILDENISINILSPNNELLNKNLDENDLSLVFLLKYYSKDILFTGDMEKVVEDYLLKQIKKQVDIIKIPHHGSNTSSNNEFLNKIKPKIGIITVGRNNLYGHPRDEVLNRYEKIGTKIYRTDTMGMIKLRLNKDFMEINTFIKEDEDFYNKLNNNIVKYIYYLLYYLAVYILIKIYINIEEKELQ